MSDNAPTAESELNEAPAPEETADAQSDTARVDAPPPAAPRPAEAPARPSTVPPRAPPAPLADQAGTGDPPPAVAEAAATEDCEEAPPEEEAAPPEPLGETGVDRSSQLSGMINPPAAHKLYGFDARDGNTGSGLLIGEPADHQDVERLGWRVSIFTGNSDKPVRVGFADFVAGRFLER